MGQPDVNRKAIIRVLAQRSTIVGLVGVFAGVMALFDTVITRDQELILIEIILMVVSVVAIITKEEMKYDGVDRRVPGLGAGGGRSDGTDNLECIQKGKAARREDRSGSAEDNR